MCGIFGIIAKDYTITSMKTIRQMVDDLFIFSESRGKEAAGILLLTNRSIHTYKKPVGASKFIQDPVYLSLYNHVNQPSPHSPFAVIGHARLATNGLQTQNRNNQPVITDNAMGVHNGIVVNDISLWNTMKKNPKDEVDTEAVFELFNYYVDHGNSYIGAMQQVYQDIEGSATLATLFRQRASVMLTTNTGSLYMLRVNNPQVVVFASEAFIIKQWYKKHIHQLTLSNNWLLSHIHAGRGFLFDLKGDDTEEFDLYSKPQKEIVSKKQPVYSLEDHSDMRAVADPTVVMLYRRLNDIGKIKKHDFDYKTIYALRRCTRCILPATTPFIIFDRHGVCNYCHEHKKIEYRGRPALEKLVAPYRSKNGEPDCIIAFSGGRDSSYGLHYLKKELGLNPIAFTYDWGMVTDIARRNEARMVGKLGVEHIIVSADITMKRDHIRKHILAWINKPDLGMVPLFMEGDKQCEFYADRLAKYNNIKLVFFCRGNELEKEEFKAGHCGVKNADPNGVIHNLSLSGKINIARYYAWQYITNPAYINSSLFDTAFAYYSTYIQKHNYIFLWHYIPWDEKSILSTIQMKYNWEVSPETVQRWRTDDGTSAFYNYIYYMGQGFTENDSFRSRQIREGLITRKRALNAVCEENKPRHEALMWYFDRVGLDGDVVLSAVDAMPRLY
mgnify:CR=1 FL=1